MNFYIKFALALAIAASSLPALAHDTHRHDFDDVQLVEIPVDGMSVEQYRKLLDEAHHSIETESTGGGFLKRWRDKFQFKQSILNAYRWYSMHKGVPYVDNAAANIAAMLLTSHSIETVGGLAMAGAGVGAGLDGITDWALTAVGITITVPGLDPLCLVLVGAYNKWPAKMDRLLTVPRLFMVNTSKETLSLAGIPDGYFQGLLAEKLKNKFLSALAAKDASIKLTSSTLNSLEFTVFGARGGQTVTLKVKTQTNGSQSVESVHFSEGASAIPKEYLKQLFAPFGFNIRNFVMEVDQALSEGKLQDMEHLPYVERVNEAERIVTAKSGALPFFRIKHSELPCEALLL
jgi:hypothetical protein